MNKRRYGGYVHARAAGHYYRECPFCGAHLDPGEVCDCGGARGQKESRPGAEDTRAAAAEKQLTRRLYPASLILVHGREAVKGEG